MNAWMLVVLLATSVAPNISDPALKSAEPGGAAAAAYALYQSGDQDAACATFLEQLRGGSVDPWSFRGAAICAAEVPARRDAALAVLEELGDSHLVLFARGYLSYRDGDLAAAEELLRRAVDQAPGFALAWNALGAVVRSHGNAQAAVPLIERALKLSPDLEMARRNLEYAKLFSGAFDRLLLLLEELPARWDTLPEPRVPMSGKRPERVFSASSEEDVRTASEFISALALAPVADRAELIERRFDAKEPTEVDLWWPGMLAQKVQTRSREEAALVIEAWLQWAAATGRRDVLFFAAGMGFDVAAVRVSSTALGPVLRLWIGLPRTKGTEDGLAKITVAYADVLFRQGESDGALEAYRRARILFQAVGDLLGKADTFQGEATVLFRLGENYGALVAYRRARTLFQAAGDLLGEGNTFQGEGDVLLRLGENEGALEAYRQARTLFQAVGDQLGEGNSFLGEAEVLFRLGENEGALEAYRQARIPFQAIGSQLGEGNTLRGEAAVLFLLGKYEGALEAYRQARTLFQAIGDLLGEGNTFEGEADVLFVLGENEGALVAYRRARALLQAVGSQLGEGNTLLGEADALFRLRDNEGALEAYRQARILFQVAGSQLGEGNTFEGEAAVLFRLGEYEGALEAYRQARSLFQAVGDLLGEGNTFQGEADVHLRLEENEEAAESAVKAREYFLKVEARPNLLNAILREAEARRRLGEDDEVIGLAKEAIDHHFSFRKSFVAEEHRTYIDQQINLAYDLLIPILAHRAESLADALTRSEEARSRVLLDILTTGRLGGEDAPLSLQQENERLRAELARVGSKLGRETEPARHRELLVERHVLDAELQRNLYQRMSADRRELEFGQPLDADAIRGMAAEVGPIVLFYAADVELFAFLIAPPPEKIHLRIIDLHRDELGNLVETFLFNLSNPLYERRAQRQAEDLWHQLLAPLAEYLPASGTLTLVPHGPLHELPFEALVIDPETGQRLCQRWDVTVTPSVSALALARRHHQAPSIDDNLVAFAAGVGLNLPEIEIRQVAGFFPASQQSTFGPAEAEFHYYEEFASRARHLLIATRGVQVEGSRRGTYLEIQPTEDVHDERLSAAEIAAIPIQAELVTLAACDTARGTALLSDERLTLVRSFLIAGATSVLATRWRIPEDQSATRFLQDFYRAYRQGGMRKDEALTEARRLSIKRGDPAQVWAAWVLVGDAR